MSTDKTQAGDPLRPDDGALSALEAHLEKREKLDEKSLVYRTFYKTLAQGFELGMSVTVGVVIGLMVDKHFDTAPWGLVWFGFSGVVASGVAAYKLIQKSKEVAKTAPPARNLYDEE